MKVFVYSKSNSGSVAVIEDAILVRETKHALKVKFKDGDVICEHSFDKQLYKTTIYQN